MQLLPLALLAPRAAEEGAGTPAWTSPAERAPEVELGRAPLPDVGGYRVAVTQDTGCGFDASCAAGWCARWPGCLTLPLHARR